jgi:hypothetical protein
MSIFTEHLPMKDALLNRIPFFQKKSVAPQFLWATEAFYQGVKPPEREADKSYPNSSEINFDP